MPDRLQQQMAAASHTKHFNAKDSAVYDQKTKRLANYKASTATNADTNTIAIVFSSLITVFKAGPAVSL